jgi:hypothetical protein
MIKLQQITSFLIGLNLVAAENIDPWAENPRIVPWGKVITDGQLVLFRQTYDAVLSFERWPYKRHPAELLFAHVCVWLLENDEERFEKELPMPVTDVDILDGQTADIDITITFEEDITAVLDENGPITFDGQRYRLDDAVISYVKEAEMA